MPENTPCKKIGNCIQFQDFVPSNPSEKLYLNTAQAVTVTCPDGTQTTVQIPAGVVGYVLKFTVGNPPYPNITLNCTGGLISLEVPDNATTSDLDALVRQLLNTCLSQITLGTGCVAGTFLNTQQTYAACDPETPNLQLKGALPAGVAFFPIGTSGFNSTALAMIPGSVTSTISVADANAKALQVLAEIFNTHQVECLGGS